MKLTDFCILFGAIVFGLFVYNDLKIKVVNEAQISQTLLNINMDEIVVDGLQAGFEGVDENGVKEVNLQLVSNHIFEEMSVLFYGKSNMRELVEKYIMGFIYIDESGYHMYDKGQWQEKVCFDEGISHSEKVDIISNIIEKRTGEIPLLAYNDGESYKNTIDDNTLIIVYCGYNFMTNEFVYKNSYLSAATIKLSE